VWIDEFGKNKANSELLKELGDGLTIENEVLFKTSEKIDILFKLFALTNNMPLIDSKDTAVYNRYKQISYGSHFDRTGGREIEDPLNLLFIADVELGDRLKNDYKDEIFNIIIDYANKYYTDKIPKIPAQFLKDTLETKTNNDEFATWFIDNCEIDSNASTPLKKLVFNSGFKDGEIKDGLKRLGYKYYKDLRGMGMDNTNSYYKGGYIGFKVV
jgi:phage/plasmid-associated DNA primase